VPIHLNRPQARRRALEVTPRAPAVCANIPPLRSGMSHRPSGGTAANTLNCAWSAAENAQRPPALPTSLESNVHQPPPVLYAPPTRHTRQRPVLPPPPRRPSSSVLRSLLLPPPARGPANYLHRTHPAHPSHDNQVRFTWLIAPQPAGRRTAGLPCSQLTRTVAAVGRPRLHERRFAHSHHLPLATHLSFNKNASITAP